MGAACVIYCRALCFLTETHPMSALSQMPFMSALTLTLPRVAACWTFLQGLRGGVFERWRRRGRRRWRRRACADKKKARCWNGYWLQVEELSSAAAVGQRKGGPGDGILGWERPASAPLPNPRVRSLRRWRCEEEWDRSKELDRASQGPA